MGGIKTLEDLIKFNEDHASIEFDTEHPDQGQLLRASRNPPSKELYDKAVFHSRHVAKDQGIDKLFREKNLNLLAYSMDALVHNIAAAAGYPTATIPLGLTSDGRPIGMGIMAQSGKEGLMLQFMSAMEAHFSAALGEWVRQRLQSVTSSPAGTSSMPYSGWPLTIATFCMKNMQRYVPTCRL